MELKCPRCGAESIQNLPALWFLDSAGIANNITSGGSRSFASQLASRLEPPSPPNKAGGLGTVIGLLIGVGGCSALVFPNSTRVTAQSAVIAFLLPIVSTVAGFLVHRLASRSDYETRAARFQADLVLWTRCYFCQGCGNVSELRHGEQPGA